jgi:hypothetical protein
MNQEFRATHGAKLRPNSRSCRNFSQTPSTPKSKPIVTCPSKMFFPLLRRVLIFCIAGLLFFGPRARGNIGSVSHPARRPAISHLINGPSEIIHLSGKSGFRRSNRNHSKREATVSSSLNWARPNPLLPHGATRSKSHISSALCSIFLHRKRAFGMLPNAREFLAEPFRLSL